MGKNIIDRELYDSFKASDSPSSIPVKGVWKRTITRADGSEEVVYLDNIVVAAGLNAIASRIGLDTTSRFGFMAVGTVTAASSLGSTVTTFGEIKRKVSSTITSSAEVHIQVCTYAGAADSLTGIALGSAAIVNHVNSGQGVALNIVNSVAATLAASDFLRLEMTVQVGSHNL
jgi:hypothetical protein